MHCLMSHCMGHYSWCLAIVSHTEMQGILHWIYLRIKYTIKAESQLGTIMEAPLVISICIFNLIFSVVFFYTAKTVEECVATHGSTLLSIFKYQKNLPLPTRQVYEQQWSTSGTRNRLHLSSLQLDSGFLQGFQHKHFLLLEEIFVAPTTWEQPDWASLYETAEAITYRDQTVIHYWNKYCKWTW